ncbi:hypothetical protein BDV59DRAFT_147111 [Aspergillus ambiguus]|uniref:uncharacterized protein n=1 Tax=Aspergillus ambiguus TaxID=176160 RepID=UPI003CCCC8C8
MSATYTEGPESDVPPHFGAKFWSWDGLYDQSPNLTIPSMCPNALETEEQTLLPLLAHGGPDGAMMEAVEFDAVPKWPHEQGFERCSSLSEPTDLSSEVSSQQFLSDSSNNPVGLYNIDNFSTTTGGDSVDFNARPPLMEGFGTNLRVFESIVGEALRMFGDIQGVIERVLGTVSKICATFETLDSKFDQLSNKVNDMENKVGQLTGTMDEIVNRERLAMEKFGNITGPPKQSAPFQSHTERGNGFTRRSSH